MVSLQREKDRRLRILWPSLAVLLLSILATPLRAEQVLIGSTSTGHLMWIADDQNFFSDHGVDVKLLEFSSGVSASLALDAGEIHLGNSSEFAFVSSLLRNRGLKLLASMARANSANLFARRDRGIAHIADLPGKRIGVTRGGIGEFFLAEVLAINGFTTDDVTLVNLRAPDTVTAIADGTVDAVITWEPFVFKAKAELGDNFVLLPEQDSYYYHFVLTGNGSWIDTHRSEVRGVLRALLDAQRFAEDNPDEAQRIIAKRFHLDPDFVRETWSKYVLEVTLMQDLISLMEQETQWLIDQGHLAGANIPDYLSVIDPQPLTSVSPDAVRMIK